MSGSIRRDDSRERVLAVFPGHYVEREKMASFKTWPARFVFTDRRIAVIDLGITGFSAMVYSLKSRILSHALYIEGEPPLGDPSYATMDVGMEMVAHPRSLSIPRSSVKKVEEGSDIKSSSLLNIGIYYDADAKNPDHILVLPYNKYVVDKGRHEAANDFRMFLDRYFAESS